MLLRLSKLHHHNVCLWRCSQESQSVPQRTPCRHACKCRSVADLVIAGHDLSWIFTLKCLIDLLSLVFRPIKNTGRRLTGLYGLIPNPQDAGVAILIPKDLLFIADSRIQKPDDDASSGQSQCAPLYLGDAAMNQGGWVKAFRDLHQSVQTRNNGISKITDAHWRNVISVYITNSNFPAHRLVYGITQICGHPSGKHEIRNQIIIIIGYYFFPVCHKKACNSFSYYMKKTVRGSCTVFHFYNCCFF